MTESTEKNKNRVPRAILAKVIEILNHYKLQCYQFQNPLNKTKFTTTQKQEIHTNAEKLDSLALINRTRIRKGEENGGAYLDVS